MSFVNLFRRSSAKQQSEPERVIPLHDTMLAEEVSEAWGAVIVSVYCANEEHYQMLPQSLKCKGAICGKCAFHPDTNRAYFRSNMEVVSITVPQQITENDLMRMNNQELIAEGYLVIKKRGNCTTYVPTIKWKRGMGLVENDLPQLTTTIQDHAGIRALPENIFREEV